MNTTSQSLLAPLTDIAVAAGGEILAVYEESRNLAVTLKADDSPVTAADERAHVLIAARLQALTPSIPVLSEEATIAKFAERRQWSSYWLVDPLDGTKEFIQRNGEFTVNIALIEDGEPVLGIVHVPVTGITYSGTVNGGAYKQVGSGQRQPIQVASMSADRSRVRVVASRNHRDARLELVLKQLAQQFADVEDVSVGSSIKICLLAEGAADLYPRLAPTSEWDTAAAHAVLRAAGGDLVDTVFAPLRYNQKETLRNPYFLGLADLSFDWREVLAGSLDEA